MSLNTHKLDDILVKIDILSNIKQDQKPIFKNKKVFIRNYYIIYTSIIRTITGESRNDIIEGFEETYNDVNRIIDDCFKQCNISNPVYHNFDIELAIKTITDFSRICDKISLLYRNESLGINALVKTYENDTEFIAKINNIKDNFEYLYRDIQIMIKELNKKVTSNNQISDPIIINNNTSSVPPIVSTRNI